MDQFHYVHSCELDTNVQVKICTLEGSLPRLNYEDLLENPILKFCGRNQSKFPDLLVEAVIASAGKPLHVPIFTSYRNFSVRWEWNQWLRLPLRYSDLPADAVLCLTLYDCSGPRSERHAVGGTSLHLFGRTSGIFRQGQVDLRVWSEASADPSGRDSNKTPGKSPGLQKENLQRLTKLSKKYRSGSIPSVDWLDRLTFAEVERINQREKQTSNMLFLMVEFQQMRFHDKTCSVVYFEKNGMLKNELSSKSDIIRCPDFDMAHDNLVEAKHHRLARSARAGQSDKDLKPNAEVRNRLNDILSYPCTQTLSFEEQDHVWRYRYYLSSNKKALAKFVKCINWGLKNESAQALDMLGRWAPMDPEDALELLGPSFRHPSLRSYAVQRLRQASDADLQLYLLQLVQALKYEKMNEVWLKDLPVAGTSSSSSLSLSQETSMDGSSLPPNTMMVEQSRLMVAAAAAIDDSAQTAQEQEDREATLMKRETNEDNSGGLAGFLIDRACKNATIANYLFWYILVECEEDGLSGGPTAATTTATAAMGGSPGAVTGSPPTMAGPGLSLQEERRVQEMYSLVLRKFRVTLKRGPQEWKDINHVLDRQHQFITKLVLLIKAVQRESGNRQKKIDRLQALLGDPEAFKFNFVTFEPLPLPLDPEIKVCSLLPDSATLFKSSLMPARLTFRTAGGDLYVTLFKHGDDLRQDQLVLQIITLMDRILQQENLDLKLTPYRVLATSSKHGFVQFINSYPIADILSIDGTIHNFFRKYSPSDSGPFGISAEVISNYLKSCAGYCVITFILGVGDRHLDNLLITESGKLFHIDFGYILGRDPKVLPPPMKLSKEMIEAFGGMNTDHYLRFRKECYTAYLSLRRYSNLILNLFSLMVDASVPDIALEPDKTVKKVQEKFRLDLSDEEAVRYMQNVIDVSAMAVMPAIVDRMHKLAQVWRN